MRIKISALARSLFFSFMSYLFVLFVIIVIDTFYNKDFVFMRAAAISAVYLGALVVLFAIMVLVFRVKLSVRKEIFEDRFKEVLAAAKEGELRCLNGKRWDGNAVLIVVDASLDSIGLNYFKIVVPRVKHFYKDYVKTEEVSSFNALSNLSPEDARLRSIMNNRRVWQAAIGISRVLDKLREDKGLDTDFDALRYWAEHANHKEWKKDEIGMVNGVGLITFQYLRMQAGIDTSMPDKIIKRMVKREFGVHANDNLQFIEEMERLSKEIGYSQILICWAIWLRESNMGEEKWEAL